MTMLTVGLVSVDSERKWIGGRYYLQHLVRAVAALPPEERVRFADVWWMEANADDPFAEVRELIDRRAIVAPPTTPWKRAARRLRRATHSWRDARDLFIDAKIDVLFPIEPCAVPGIPLVFWMPDFQPWRMPELFSDDLRAWYEQHYRTNGEAAARIVVSSEDGLRDLQRFMPQFRDKASVLHFCSIPTAEWWEREPAAVAREYSLPDKFFLLANQFSHHKNHMAVFDAVRLLRERGVPVVVACTGSTFGFRGSDYLDGIQSFLAAHNLSDAVHILDLIPRHDQVALMRRSIGLLQPSKFEGWSTVVEDARSLGKPIILSNLEVHLEQNPPGATFVPPDDSAAWAEAMQTMWETRGPGPYAHEETRAAKLVEKAAIETGRTFVDIVNRAAGV